ncbi:MAG TPA: hypothetical protein DCW74_04345 [Alteromonas australica]|uniref:RNA polymerase sigma-70 domain-containing protein n=1 Tax=Alteromonas australica TaxID=589873 RepID=A0A350P0Y4_9ALTE|nr:hypothetical protein [Alteromonas australica]|tara:strand:- start:154 stop:1071 length:918 start_codon:yes stop_codon:yes gene_type:complete
MRQINEICARYKSIDPLSREEEQVLFSQYKYYKDRLALVDLNDPECAQLEKKIERIQEKIIRANVRFVCVIARPFCYRHNVEIEDMVAEGVIGLMRALDKFEVQANTKFISYAVFWIRNHIERSVENSKMIRLNYGIIRNIEGFKRDRRRIEQMLERAVSLREAVELNEETTTKPNWGAETWDVIESTTLSLDKSYGESREEGMDTPMVERIASRQNSDPLLKAIEKEQKHMIKKLLLEALDYRERKAVEWFYGLNGKEQRTCEAIAQDFNFSRQRVSQILEIAERKILRQVRNYKISRNLIGVN